jgi:hypothetical protein
MRQGPRKLGRGHKRRDKCKDQKIRDIGQIAIRTTTQIATGIEASLHECGGIAVEFLLIWLVGRFTKADGDTLRA